MSRFDIDTIAAMAGLSIPVPSQSLSTRPAGLHPTFRPVTERDPAPPTDPRDQPLAFEVPEAARVHLDAWRANRGDGGA